MTNARDELEEAPIAADVRKEMDRIKRLFESQRGDKEDLISYAMSIVKLRAHPPAQQPEGERAPKVRTSHHRNKEEAARLQALVDKRYEEKPATPPRPPEAGREEIVDFVDQIRRQDWKRGHYVLSRDQAIALAMSFLATKPAQDDGADQPFMMREVLDFLNSIEGAGYGGMASFEIVRGYVRNLARPSMEGK